MWLRVIIARCFVHIMWKPLPKTQVCGWVINGDLSRHAHALEMGQTAYSTGEVAT